MVAKYRGYPGKIKEFLDNLDWHLNMSRSHYKYGQSDGKSVRHHANCLSNNEAMQIREKILRKSIDIKSRDFLTKYNIT